VSAAEYLQVGAFAVAGAGCEAEGLIGRASEGGLLVCHQGRWQLSGSDFGGIFMTHTWRSCHRNRHIAEFFQFASDGVDMTNPRTGECSCPAGFSPRLLAIWRFQQSELAAYRSFICLR
jgi:hypothetical protein